MLYKISVENGIIGKTNIFKLIPCPACFVLDIIAPVHNVDRWIKSHKHSNIRCFKVKITKAHLRNIFRQVTFDVCSSDSNSKFTRHRALSDAALLGMNGDNTLREQAYYILLIAIDLNVSKSFLKGCSLFLRRLNLRFLLTKCRSREERVIGIDIAFGNPIQVFLTVFRSISHTLNRFLNQITGKRIGNHDGVFLNFCNEHFVLVTKCHNLSCRMAH